MKTLLLDTHALLWWLLDGAELSKTAREAIGEGTHRILVSAASAWEIATKHRLGKLPEAEYLVRELPRLLRAERFEPLPMKLEHALAAGRLPGPHRDPFDRMLMAQAELEKAQIVTCDPIFREYGMSICW